MAQTRKSIVLGVERDNTAFTVGELSTEGCAQVICLAGDVEALIFEEVCEDLVGVDFLVADLRVLPDLYKL
jgi:hypothetical protein